MYRELDFMEDVVGETVFAHLAETAERARWRLSDVQWGSIDRKKIPEVLPPLVKEMAFGEQTTLSATQKFLNAFTDDLDFTQWMSVWFYEETRHPMALMRWLKEIGVHCDSDFVTRGRVSTPFMRSRMGTLVTNVISEVNASCAYASLAEVAEEPILRGIALRLSADEARHASSFYRYSARRLERSTQPERERVDAVKVLRFWLQESERVTHPVNQVLQRVKAKRTLAPEEVRERACRLVGTLVDLPLDQPEDVEKWLAPLIAQAHEAGQATV
jgi:ferritin